MYRGVNSLESLSDLPGIAPQTGDMGGMPLADSLTMCYSDGLDGIQRGCNGSLWMVKGPGNFQLRGLAPQSSFEYVSNISYAVRGNMALCLCTNMHSRGLRA